MSLKFESSYRSLFVYCETVYYQYLFDLSKLPTETLLVTTKYSSLFYTRSRQLDRGSTSAVKRNSGIFIDRRIQEVAQGELESQVQESNK